MRRLVMVGAVAAVVMSGCTDGTGPGRVPGTGVLAAASLERFAGCDALLDHVRPAAVELVGPYGMPGGVGHHRGAVELDTLATDQAGAPEAGRDFSATNIQEPGVDEPDIVKTDGRWIFTVNETTLRATDVRAAEPAVVGAIELDKGWGHELLLSGSRLLVVSRGGSAVRPMPMPEPGRDALILPIADDVTLVSVVDVSDPSRMRVVSTLELEGSLVSSRLADGQARLVVRSHGPRVAFVTPQELGGSERDATRHNRRLVERTDAGDWLPVYRLVDEAGTESTGTAVACDQAYHPAGEPGVGSVSVVSIDPADPQPRRGASVVGNAEIVYATAGSLYVAASRWEPGQGAVPRDPDDAVTSDIMPTPDGRTVTEMHRFDTSGRGEARYASSGAVLGRLLNQWALSEHEGHLRVAATIDRFGPRGDDSESVVSVLAERNGQLVEVGSVGDLGRGERIFAVRFMGPVGYVVTFRQIDPLYTVDLSDPGNPRVLGELKIPGYSAYLHPIGPGLLLGVGQDATDEGRVRGTQVSVFDVSDLASPRRLHVATVAGGFSEAEHDHHAFLYWPARELAVIPVQTWEPESMFAGAVAMRTGAEGIQELARLDHPARSAGGLPGGPGYPVPIRRALVVGDALYTVSDAGLMATDLGSMQRRAWVPFG